MAVEIERKFLVRADGWRDAADGGTPMRQGYLMSDQQGSVRVRQAGAKAKLTIKGGGSLLERMEFEYEIPPADAEAMLDQLARGPLIEKTRYRVPVGEHVWEVDVFAGDNAGLVLAEVELGAADEGFQLPDWAGQEVTDDPRYLNANLVKQPWGQWGR